MIKEVQGDDGVGEDDDDGDDDDEEEYDEESNLMTLYHLWLSLVWSVDRYKQYISNCIDFSVERSHTNKSKLNISFNTRKVELKGSNLSNWFFLLFFISTMQSV